MKEGFVMKILLICALVLLTVSGIAYASGHFWRCRYCGRGVNSDNCPPVGKCDKNPFGGGHDWQMTR